jgi:DNA/RNA endonuclease G (NUC1)/PKD repeat protein
MGTRNHHVVGSSLFVITREAKFTRPGPAVEALFQVEGVRKTFARLLLPSLLAALALLVGVPPADAIVDVNLQMQLGNPSGASADPNNHLHYLIQREVEAIDYSDVYGQANWVSWDLTSGDVGSSGRTDAWSVDTNLPPGFYPVPTDSYGYSGGQLYVRGHMCPSTDRTDTTEHNAQLFIMSNIIPQAAAQNGAVWGALESYSHTLLSSNELLILCGPSNFGTNTVDAGHVGIASNTWKIVVCVPLGGSNTTALSRIDYSTRVIAVVIPNTDAISTLPWTDFVTSVKQVEEVTGFRFFTALPTNLAWVLRSKVDGQTPAAPGVDSFFPPSGPAATPVTITGTNLDSITNVTFNGTIASYTIDSPGQITALVPADAASGPITVMGLGGNATSSSDFTVTLPVAPEFIVTPSDVFASVGNQGGPFSPSSEVYTLTNTDTKPLNWAVGKNAPWLDLSATSGTLAAGASTDITASVNSAANSLAGGAYSATVMFSDLATGAWVTRSVGLTALLPGYLTVGPGTGFSSTGAAGGPFNPSNQVYTLSNTGSATLNWAASKSASWFDLSQSSGSLAGGSSTVVTVSITSDANSLPLGSYSDTVGITNTTTGAGNTTRPVTLTVAVPAPILVANGSTLVSEDCAPTNGAVDPGESVTVNFSLSNAGNANTSNLVATLLETSDVITPSGPQTYGVVVANGPAVAQPFAFTAGGSCGGTITALLQLQDGETNLGTNRYTIPLGQSLTPLSEDFDGAAAPALPSGWTTSSSGGQSNWVTSVALPDTEPNAAFSGDNGAAGVNELESPVIAINGSAAQLSFRQDYSLMVSATNPAVGYSGGVLEIKLGSGSYTDIVAAGGSFASGGYNATLSGAYENPLAGRRAWSGTSGGYTTTVVNLPAAAAGRNVQLRWRCGTGNPPTVPFYVEPLASSGTLAYWSFDSTNAIATTVGAGVSVSSFTVSNVTGALTFFGGNPGQAIASSGFTTNAGPPSNGYSYFGFTMTVTNDSQVSLSSLSFDDRASNTGPKTFDVQISTQADFSTVTYDSGAKNTHGTFAANTLSLTNAGLTGTNYFRIYGYAAGGAGGTWRLDNVKVLGTVTSANGGGAWLIDSVSVKDAICCGVTNPPAAEFTATPTSGREPLTVTFTDTSAGTVPLSLYWDLGDNTATNTAGGASFTHTYAAGNYSVTLTASNAAGTSTIVANHLITSLTAFQAWQIQYFGCTNCPEAEPDADPLGKGMSNTNQFLVGLDPTNPASLFRIISVTKQGNDMLITWTAAGAHTNAVQATEVSATGDYSTNFTDASGLVILQGSGDVTTNYLDAGGATNIPSRYYRVRLVP